MSKLGDYTKIATGKLDANASSKNGEYPFFTCSKNPLRIDTYSYNCECALVAGNGDLNVKYYNGKFDAYQRTYIIESNNKKDLLVPYLYLFLSNYLDTLRRESIGGVIKYIKIGNLTDAKLPLPPIVVQKKIADELDKITGLIEKRKKQIEKMDLLVKAKFVEMFGDPVTNPMGWRKDILKNICSKIGSGSTPRGGKESYVMEGTSLIRSMNVYNGYFKYKNLVHLTEDQSKQLNNVRVEKNDVLINITGASVARCCIVPSSVLPARVNQHVSILRCKCDMNSRFINNLIVNNSIQNKLLSIAGAGGATREAITKQQLEFFSMITPPITLQTQFADYVTKVESQKETMQKSLIKLETLYKAQMQAYFE